MSTELEQLTKTNEPDSESLKCPTAPAMNEGEPTLSKKAMKRKMKHEKWLKWRPIKRAKEREKLKQKKQFARENNLPLGPSRKALKLVKMENSPNKLRICIDFSFDHLMTQKDICKCVKQFNRCYSLNRRATNPLQFYVSSFKNKSKEEMQRYNGYQHWDVNIHEKTYLELFKKEDLVYLTSDSENIIHNLDTSKVYIIGGLVDHNQHKLISLNKANAEGIQHGKLPIDTYLNMKTRQVLAVNHVFEILLDVSSEKSSWKDALLKTLPERKNAEVKEDLNDEYRDEDENEINDSGNENLQDIKREEKLKESGNENVEDIKREDKLKESGNENVEDTKRKDKLKETGNENVEDTKRKDKLKETGNENVEDIKREEILNES